MRCLVFLTCNCWCVSSILGLLPIALFVSVFPYPKSLLGLVWFPTVKWCRVARRDDVWLHAHETFRKFFQDPLHQVSLFLYTTPAPPHLPMPLPTTKCLAVAGECWQVLEEEWDGMSTLSFYTYAPEHMLLGWPHSLQGRCPPPNSFLFAPHTSCPQSNHTSSSVQCKIRMLALIFP